MVHIVNSVFNFKIVWFTKSNEQINKTMVVLTKNNNIYRYYDF